MAIKKILLLLLLSSGLFAQPLTFKIAKAKTNFVTIPSSTLVNEPNCVFSFNGTKVGNTVVDISGSGNNSTATGAVANGGVEGGLQFNGINSKVVTTNNITNISTALTVNFRLLKTANTAVGVIATQGITVSTASAEQWNIFFDGSGYLVFNVSNGTVKRTLTSASPLANSRIYNITCKWDAANDSKLYIDGVLQSPTLSGTAISTIQSIGRPLSLGYDNSGSRYPSNIILYNFNLYNAFQTAQQTKDYHNKLASKIYINEDFSDGTVGKFPSDWTRISGTHVVATGTPKYLNCTSTGNLYFTTRDNASSCYMTYDYYTAGAWTSEAGLVSALSTAETTLDYSATTRKLTFIMATNDRVRNIKIIRGAIVQ